ncbi:cytochrome p450 domain-containing protein [Trichoderma breve]|uniref:Cytochrome p450 domain-containing protein n=1 Tax=Trichoderma breve TaxID=2034170 RepID=A0A9W9BGG1_9HYPO|nr:cytochrome p450 domain-containing protein [Trichoderma breve]KAJ4859935.1 cytochrome p450 domain-containing protein [Trichoderma breve]
MLSHLVNRLSDYYILTLPLFVVLVYFLLSAQRSSRIKPFPGPPFRFPNGQGTEKFFSGRNAARRWRNSYGSIYSIWSGFKREVVITKPEHVQAFYKDSHNHIKASDNNAGWLFGELLGSCVGVVSQKRWVRVRAPFEHHFTRPASLKRSLLFLNESRVFLQSMNKENNSTTINVTDDLKYCPFFMVASIFFGPLSAAQRHEIYMIGPLREVLFRDAFSGGVNRYSFAKYLPGSAMPKLREFQRRWEDFVKRSHDEATLNSGGAIVSLWETVERGGLSKEEKQLLQTLDESLFANLDVTAHALSWAMLRIAHHTSTQHDVRQEIGANSHSEEDYEEYLRQDNTLLAACILESSRLHPILLLTAFSNPESALTDKTVGDFKILRNTDVIVDSYAINVDNAYWEDSTIFNPRRHLGQRDQSRRYNMWRFGFGPRQCLGKNVADIILRVIVAEMVRCYRIDIIGKGGIDGIELQADSWIGLPECMVKLTPHTG